VSLTFCYWSFRPSNCEELIGSFDQVGVVMKVLISLYGVSESLDRCSEPFMIEKVNLFAIHTKRRHQ